MDFNKIEKNLKKALKASEFEKISIIGDIENSIIFDFSTKEALRALNIACELDSLSFSIFHSGSFKAYLLALKALEKIFTLSDKEILEAIKDFYSTSKVTSSLFKKYFSNSNFEIKKAIFYLILEDANIEFFISHKEEIKKIVQSLKEEEIEKNYKKILYFLETSSFSSREAEDIFLSNLNYSQIQRIFKKVNYSSPILSRLEKEIKKAKNKIKKKKRNL